MSNRAESRANPEGRSCRVPRERRPKGLRTLDGVIMLSPDGRPAGGSFPDNVWVVMGGEADSVEEFFGDCDDVITAEPNHPRVGTEVAFYEGRFCYPLEITGINIFNEVGGEIKFVCDFFL